jgi:hypothetical protein
MRLGKNFITCMPVNPEPMPCNSRKNLP